eukprot:jgi/Tetstr1/441379/TSEL_029628.t1
MALKAIGDVLAKVGIKAPWKVTGVASHVEYKDAILKASNSVAVRRGTPASQPEKVAIPNSEPENVFNIRYYDRKERMTAATWPSHPTPPTPSPYKTVVPEGEKPVTLGKPFRWGKTVPYLDYENNGYTM